MAPLVRDSLCITMSGLSKMHRACGYRVGWAVFSGDVENSRDYLSALELLSSLRLCSNVAGQWAVQTALGGCPGGSGAGPPGGRLYESRNAIVDAVARSRYLAAHRAARCHVCLRRRRHAASAGIRRPPVRHGPAPSTSTCWSPRVPASMCRTTPISGSPTCRNARGAGERLAGWEKLLDNYAAGDEPVSRPTPLRAVEA